MSEQSPPVLLGTLNSPIPDDAVTDWVYTLDKTRLRYALFGTSSRPLRGTVCVFMGRGEFIEKYFEVAQDLRERDFAVAVLEWRGQGESDRPLRNHYKGHINHFASYDDDLTCFMQNVVLPDCPPPYYALAHSMGANIVLRALDERTWFSRVVAVCPLVHLMPPSMPWPLIRLAAEVLSVLGLSTLYLPGGDDQPAELSPFQGNRLTSDPVRYERTVELLEANRKLGLGGATIGWLAAAFQAMIELRRKRFPRPLKAPVLMLAAGQDRVVSSKAIYRLGQRLPNSREITVDGALHEILMERDEFREQFWAAFDAFVPGAPEVAQPARTSSAAE
ncbi:MAG: alpha/beta fold hydrolase [Hyphomicrobiales bacterium]